MGRSAHLRHCTLCIRSSRSDRKTGWRHQYDDCIHTHFQHPLRHHHPCHLPDSGTRCQHHIHSGFAYHLAEIGDSHVAPFALRLVRAALRETALPMDKTSSRPRLLQLGVFTCHHHRCHRKEYLQCQHLSKYPIDDSPLVGLCLCSSFHHRSSHRKKFQRAHQLWTRYVPKKHRHGNMGCLYVPQSRCLHRCWLLRPLAKHHQFL